MARASVGAGVLMIALASAMWGTVGVATQLIYGMSQANALTVGFFRLAIAAPVLLAVGWLLLGRRMFAVRRRDWWLFAGIGALTAAYQVCLFSAIPFVGVSIAVVVTLCVAPVVVAVSSVWLFGEPLTRGVVLALACALGGTALLAGGGAGLPTEPGAMLLGVALAVGSAVGYAGIALIGRAQAGRYHPIQPVAFGFGFGALLLLPCALAQGLVVDLPPLAWGLLLHLGLLPTALGYVLFFFGIRGVSATAASVITLIEPLTAAALAWAMFGERLSAAGALGAGLLLVAIGLLSWREAAPQRAARAAQ